jgi:hypothetical protein
MVTTSSFFLLATDIYSFNAIVPLESGTSLDEVVKLWDFMFAFGAHLNILFTVARVIKARYAFHFATSSTCTRIVCLLMAH